MDVAGRQEERRVASRANQDVRTDRLPEFLVALVMCVLVAWIGLLLYLGFKFL